MIPEHFEWVGNKLFFRDEYTLVTYSCKVKLTWKKVPKAYGYVVSTTKIKAGDYVSVIGNGYSHTVTRKTKFTYYAQPIQKDTRELVLYVAPLSKNGYIGKVKKCTITIR